MTILLPVISHSVDQVILDYLSQIQYGDLASTIDGNWNQNNNNTIDDNNNNQVDHDDNNNNQVDHDDNNNNQVDQDDNNNNQVDHDDIGEEVVGDWAEQPWTPRDDVDIPEWAKLEGSKVNDNVDVCADLVWADDPWTQTPLIDIPAWMRLPGIDYDIPEAPIDNKLETNDEKISDAQENDDNFLDSFVEIKNWADEKYKQRPLDVPRWALLPGIDFPVRIRGKNSDYWEGMIRDYAKVRGRFAEKVFKRKLPFLLEERVAYNNHGDSILYVQTRFGRRY